MCCVESYLQDEPRQQERIRLGTTLHDIRPATKSITATLRSSFPASRYWSLNAFITGAIVENASGVPLDQFARKYLFSALGIDDFKWRHVPVNRVVGQGNLYITTRDEAAIGQLFLQKGRWRNQRLVSAKWVRDSFSDIVPISAVDPYADFYGYMWYTRAEPV